MNNNKDKEFYKSTIYKSYNDAVSVFEEAFAKYCPKEPILGSNGDIIYDQEFSISADDLDKNRILSFYLKSNGKLSVMFYVKDDIIETIVSKDFSEYSKNKAVSSYIVKAIDNDEPHYLHYKFNEYHLYEAMKAFADACL